MKYAMTISAAVITAANLVNNPNTIAKPPKNSITPAKPIKLINSAGFPPRPPNQPNNFWPPCCKNKTPTTTLKRK